MHRLLVCIMLMLQLAAAKADDLESNIKATYINKFSLYVEWPNPAVEFPGGSFVICVAGLDAVGQLLRGLNGQQFNDHAIVVRTAVSRQCSILYATGADAAVAADLAAVSGAPVLTITNEATTPASTGIINLVLIDNHVRFAVNLASADHNNLRLSSKLLNIAVR